MRHRRAPLAGLIVLLALGAFSWGRTASSSAVALPARLTDGEFWRLVETFSEPGGTFHSDNFVSNEGRYQVVIPDLVSRTKAAGVYLGVGPEQNFTYIAAIRPKMAFIIDIRRGNLHEHLLYKALMEMSVDRADFLSRLFSRPRPAGLTAAATADALFDAYRTVQPTEELFRRNLKAVLTLLTGTRGFRLQPDDGAGIEYIYKNAFFDEGPELGYALTGRGRLGQTPSYAELMTMGDATGKQWSYLATEPNFAFVKDLQSRNLLVPIVGNFGGPKALRAVGEYLRGVGATVTAFYLSNVEQYLRQDGLWGTFCENVRAMPLDSSSTFIRSTRGGGRGFVAPAGRGMFTSDLGVMRTDTANCAAGALAARPMVSR